MSKIPSTENIISELENGWLTIWFNRVEKRNALSKELIMDLFQILDEVHDDRSVRGIIFRGKGGTFCAGADLKVFQEIINAGDNARELATNASHLVGKLRKFHLEFADHRLCLLLRLRYSRHILSCNQDNESHFLLIS